MGRLTDLVVEAWSGVRQRPGRTVLTALGTVLGVGAFVGTVAVGTSAGAAVTGHFDELRGTELRIQENGSQQATGRPLGLTSDGALEAINGVEASGVSWLLPSDTTVVRLPGGDGHHARGLQVVAASPGFLNVVGAQLYAGRLFGDVHDSRGFPVAVIGSGAARTLGVDGYHLPVGIEVGGQPFTVIGVMAGSALRDDLTLSVVVPRGSVGSPPDGSAEVVVVTSPGAVRQVAAEAVVALRPEAPQQLVAFVPPEPKNLRAAVEQELQGLLLAIAGVSLLIGTIGIANTALVSVLERRGEIGLRRSLGASKGQITLQFLLESALTGVAGGLAGTMVAAVGLVGLAAARGWEPVVEPALLIVAPALGLLTGVAGGAIPAVRAARVQPLDALRR